MMPQFSNLRNKVKNYKNIATGIFIFSIGLFKKVVIADTFAVWANKGFDVATTLNLFEAWATYLSYTFQLYFDFSGYCDMAIGVALLFNIKLPINFNSPYKTLNIQDFWRKWHITLSRFLRDYIYIPMGGSRNGNIRTYTNLMATFIIGGFWHGAGWTFLFLGFLHGFALGINRFWQKLGFKMWTWLAWLITFNFVNIVWVFFRAKELEDAIKVLSGMVGFTGIVLKEKLLNELSFLTDYGVEFDEVTKHIGGGSDSLKWIIIAFIIVLLFNNSIQKMNSSIISNKTLTLIIIYFIYSIFSLNKISEFLYFNF